MKHVKMISPIAIIFAMAMIFPSLSAAEEEGGGEAMIAALPVSVEAWVDARAAYKSYSFDAEGVDDVNQSDVYVRYAGVGFHAEPNPHLEAQLVFLFEEFFAEPDGDNFGMDEGWLKVKYGGAYVSAGKMFPAFTYEDTDGIEDPLTWHFGDCRKTAVELGYENSYVALSAAFFNGDFDLTDDLGNPEDEAIDDYVIHARLTPMTGDDGYLLDFGFSYLSDFAETELDFGNAFFMSPVYEDPVPGYSGHAAFIAPVGSSYEFGLEAVYIASGEFDELNYVDLDGDQSSVSLMHAELSLAGDGKWWIGAGYDQISGLDWLGANEADPSLTPTRYAAWNAFAGAVIFENASVALQVAYGEDDEGDTALETYGRLLIEF